MTLNGIRFHYLDWGNEQRPHVVLLHGGSLTAHTRWRRSCCATATTWWPSTSVDMATQAGRPGRAGEARGGKCMDEGPIGAAERGPEEQRRHEQAARAPSAQREAGGDDFQPNEEQ